MCSWIICTRTQGGAVTVQSICLSRKAIRSVGEGEEIKVFGSSCIECGRLLPTSVEEWENRRIVLGLTELTERHDNAVDCETCRWRFNA